MSTKRYRKIIMPVADRPATLSATVRRETLRHQTSAGDNPANWSHRLLPCMRPEQAQTPWRRMVYFMLGIEGPADTG